MVAFFDTQLGRISKIISPTIVSFILINLIIVIFVYSEIGLLRVLVGNQALEIIEDNIFRGVTRFHPHVIVEKLIFFYLLSIIILGLIERRSKDFPRFKLQFSWLPAVVHVTFLSTFSAMSFLTVQRVHLVESLAVPWTLLWLFLEMMVVGSAFFIFTNIEKLWEVWIRYWKQCIIGGGLTFFFLLLNRYDMVQLVWKPLSYSIGKLIAFLLSITHPAVYYETQSFILGIGDFALKISGRCSGVEGMSLFLIVMTAIVVIDWKRINKVRAFLLYPLGILMMYYANILRIYLITLLGYVIFQKWGPEVAYRIVIEHFHSHIGWILYVVLILFFIRYAYPFTLRPDSSPPQKLQPAT